MNAGFVADFLELLAREAGQVEFDRPGLEARAAGAPADVLDGIDQARAVALRVRALLERRRRREAELSALVETVADLATLHDLDAVLEAIVRRARKQLGADLTYMTLHDEERGDTYMRVTDGSVSARFQQLRLPMGGGLGGLVAQNATPYVTANYREDARFRHLTEIDAAVAEEGIVAIAGVPVRLGSRILGVLFAANRSARPFSREEVTLLGSLAAHAAVAIDNARLYTAAQQAAADRTQLLERERQARAHAERMSDLKDEFLATLSHELRTPLGAILGWAQLLRRGRRSEEDVGRGLEIIERNARTQTQLIDDLLDMNRLLAGKMRLEVQPVDPATVIESALETVRPAAEAKGITLRTVLDPAAGPVNGDASRLQQVLWNLLSNAIKFTPRDGMVDVVLQQLGAHAEIRIADTGIGIAPDFLPLVFERFRQADASPSRRFGGLGLGLSIARQLVELHGGTLRGESAGEGRGATFTVALPLATVARAAPKGAPAAPAVGADGGADDLTGITVLVVDDDRDTRELMDHVLTERGARVLAAASAMDALPLVEHHRPDVLVSDIGMPHVDGYELLRRVRALGAERGGRIPAIALTAFARPEDRTRALRSGFLTHVAKPVGAAELIAAVAAVVRR